MWWKSGTILRAVGVDGDTAARVERFSRIRIPGLFLQCVTCVLLKTMLAMKRSRRVAALSVCTTPLKFLAPWWAIRKFRNLEGAAIGLTCVDIGTFSMYAVGFATSTALRSTLKGVRVFPDAFRDWWGYLRLAIPGMGMQCIEWWSWDFNTALAGLCANPTLELDAQAFLSNAYFFFYSWACVWSRGASTSVGNAVGAGNTRDAATLAASTVIVCFRCCVLVVVLRERGFGVCDVHG
jgi:MATE family multidrug resistance protein